MDSATRRQIKDIQYRADRIINGRPSLVEIEEFDEYNEELRRFLLEKLEDPELIARVKAIPRIMDETEAQTTTRNFIMSILAAFSSGVVAYFRDRQKVINAIGNVHEAKGKYSSIEFLSKNLE